MAPFYCYCLKLYFNSTQSSVYFSPVVYDVARALHKLNNEIGSILKAYVIQLDIISFKLN